MSAIFVTGTGTGVGKTYVVRDLIGYERACGRSVEAVKPIVTGFDPDALEGSDPALLLEALGRPLNAETIAAISPWRFRDPLSPDMAAAREKRSVPFDDLIAFCRSAKADHVFIEGIGGAMTPLDQMHTVRDWIAALEIPAILVAGSYLGAISHTLTSLEALNAKRISVREIAISESAQSPVPPSETAATLARFIAVPIRILPRGILTS
jgi:dethiobiotin synthetase